MVTTPSIADQIIDQLSREEGVLITASIEEYWATVARLSDEPMPVAYNIEYIDGQIRAKVSAASDNHETIVANVAALLRAAFYDAPGIRVMGSNKLIYVPSSGCELAANPDVLVMNGPNQLLPRPGKVAGITNPYIVVEVRSDSTEKHDMTVKLRCYKQIESISQIIYIEQLQPYVTVWTKGATNQHWLNDDYTTLDARIRIGDGEIAMHEIYHKVLLAKIARPDEKLLS